MTIPPATSPSLAPSSEVQPPRDSTVLPSSAPALPGAALQRSRSASSVAAMGSSAAPALVERGPFFPTPPDRPAAKPGFERAKSFVVLPTSSATGHTDPVLEEGVDLLTYDNIQALVRALRDSPSSVEEATIKPADQMLAETAKRYWAALSSFEKFVSPRDEDYARAAAAAGVDAGFLKQLHEDMQEVSMPSSAPALSSPALQRSQSSDSLAAKASSTRPALRTSIVSVGPTPPTTPRPTGKSSFFRQREVLVASKSPSVPAVPKMSAAWLKLAAEYDKKGIDDFGYAVEMNIADPYGNIKVLVEALLDPHADEEIAKINHGDKANLETAKRYCNALKSFVDFAPPREEEYVDVAARYNIDVDFLKRLYNEIYNKKR